MNHYNKYIATVPLSVGGVILVRDEQVRVVVVVVVVGLVVGLVVVAVEEELVAPPLLLRPSRQGYQNHITPCTPHSLSPKPPFSLSILTQYPLLSPTSFLFFPTDLLVVVL